MEEEWLDIYGNTSNESTSSQLTQPSTVALTNNQSLNTTLYCC